MNKSKKIKTGSDFCGVGAFDQAIERLGLNQDKQFACDWDKFARQTYILNYGEPKYFPKSVYDRKIPKESLDVYMTSPPCQAFSNIGKRLGEEDSRGVLFYNSHEFININRPRYFIFENVKGLISHDKKNKNDEIGRTFRRWLDFLGGKSINGNPVLFPHPNSVPYHLYYFVLNAKDYNIPQNRERVFVVGIRDDNDNFFDIPKPMELTKKIKDCLEPEVDEKYFLSKKKVKYFIDKTIKQKQIGNGFNFSPKRTNDNHFNAITTKAGSRIDDNFLLIENKKDKIFRIKESRTEEAKKERKLTGKNKFRSKKIEFVEMGLFPTLTTQLSVEHNILINGKIRKLTPKECFNAQDFSKKFKINVSDNQAYKQAGNSIPVGLLVKILEKFNF